MVVTLCSPFRSGKHWNPKKESNDTISAASAYITHTLFMCLCSPGQRKKATVKFVIDCMQPVDDSILDVASFEKYLHDKIKIGGKTGMLAANNVTISRDCTKLMVASPSDLHFSKHQLKYLSKRYFKNNNCVITFE